MTNSLEIASVDAPCPRHAQPRRLDTEPLPPDVPVPTTPHDCTHDDNVLKGKVEVALSKSPYSQIRTRVTVVVHEGLVQLHGVLPSYYLKQMAFETIKGVPGMIELDLNHLVVVYPPKSPPMDDSDPIDGPARDQVTNGDLVAA